MIVYLLIYTCDRETTVTKFNTYSEAYDKMKKEYEEAGNAENEMLDAYLAYKTDANNHSNFDWMIHTLQIDTDQIYRESQKEYRSQDACRHIVEVLTKDEKYDDIDKDEVVENMFDTIIGEMHEKAVQITQTVSDIVNKFLSKYDCNIDENTQWEILIEDWFKDYPAQRDIMSEYIDSFLED